MLGLRLCLVLAALGVLGVAPAHADTPKSEGAVALLPLDADARLAIYGQPVASEIARALVVGGVEVVVVGPKMAVPERARLVVDGTISSNKSDVVVLALRVRNPVDGTTLATTQATAQGLANIDKAAAELSAKVLPIVKQQILALGHPADVRPTPPEVHIAVVAPPSMHPLLLALIARAPAGEPLRAALSEAITPWAAAVHRESKAIDAPKLAGKLAASSVKEAGGELAISFEVKSFEVTQGKVPFARARVRVRIVDASSVLFDRVVVTDSVLGERGSTPEVLAQRTAREVLDILRPHLRRLVASWH
jgi:hypothetical protein